MAVAARTTPSTRKPSFIGINNFTKGTEFYGPAADISFLSELRSLTYAQSHEQVPVQEALPDIAKAQRQPFIANELYPGDDIIRGEICQKILLSL